MINPFDYLYYKMYRAWYWLNGGYSQGPGTVIMLLYTVNFITIYAVIARELPPAELIGGCLFFTFIIFLFLYRSKREKKIIVKYGRKSTESRETGNIIVVFYVIISIVAFIWAMKKYV
jgi:hypothetical protein